MLYHSVDYSFYLKTGFLGKPCYVKRIVEALSKKKTKTRIYKDELSHFKNWFDFSLQALYRGIHEKGSGDVVSAICYTIYTIYLSLCTPTAETTSPETFS